MVHLSAVDAQNLCRFYHVKLRLCASSRFTTISMVARQIWSGRGWRAVAAGVAVIVRHNCGQILCWNCINVTMPSDDAHWNQSKQVFETQWSLYMMRITNSSHLCKLLDKSKMGLGLSWLLDKLGRLCLHFQYIGFVSVSNRTRSKSEMTHGDK